MFPLTKVIIFIIDVVFINFKIDNMYSKMSVRIIYICVKKCPFFYYNCVKKISPAALHFINVNPPPFQKSLIGPVKVIMKWQLFQRCTHLSYCSVLSLGGNVNPRRLSKSDMGSIFHIKDQWNIMVIGNYYVNYQNYQNLMLLTSSDT